MHDADKGAAPPLDGRRLRVAMVQARFNAGVTGAIAAACHAELLALGVAAQQIRQLQVPGALELPLALQALAERGGCDALIAIGCVLRGATYHFELVANESAAGLMRLALDYRIPVVNAILTTDNLAQALERQHEKGRDAARVALEMANLLAGLS